MRRKKNKLADKNKKNLKNKQMVKLNKTQKILRLFCVFEEFILISTMILNFSIFFSLFIVLRRVE